MGRKKMKTVEKVDVRLRMESELAERIQGFADRLGMPVAAFIRSTVIKEMDRLDREAGK